MKFEYEEFETIEDVLIYLVSVAPYMKQVLPISSYKERGMYEFDISTKKHKLVTAMERADKNYFIVITPQRDTLADAALSELNRQQQQQQ
jgi:hypothetical protein